MTPTVLRFPAQKPTTLTQKLTKRVIDATPCPTQGQTFIRDTEIRGFAVRLTPGAKTFIVEKRANGKLHRVTIGAYGVYTVEQARARAREILHDIYTGIDPNAVKRQARQQATLADLWQLYLERHAPRKRSAMQDQQRFARHLTGWLPRKLSSIKRADIARLHTAIGRDRPYEANRTVTLLRKLFALAALWGLHDGENPARGIEHFREDKRDRFVRPDELPRLFAAIEAEPSRYVQALFTVSLLTGARVGEVRTMRWTDVDLDQGVWRIPTTKNRHPHYVPLPQPVVALLQALPRLSGCAYVFPGRDGDAPLVNLWKPWGRIRKRAGLPDVRPHDLRRTLGSWLAAAGASLPLIGKALNHAQPSTTAIYARLALDPVRDALERNAAHMLGIAGKPQA